MFKKIALLDICILLIIIVFNTILSIFNPLESSSILLKYSYISGLLLFALSVIILTGCIIYSLIKIAFED